MVERDYSTEITKDQRWSDISSLPAVDFWFGSQYKGSYYQRLQVDLKAVENICSAANLPPIVLRSDKWNPPAVYTPEMVAPGLSAFKKVSFQKGSQIPDSDKKNYRLSVTEDVINYHQGDIPIGWIISLKDRKWVYEYQVKHPGSLRSDLEKYYLSMMNSTLRSGLVDVSLGEVMNLRMANKSDRYYDLGVKAIQQAIALMSGLKFSGGLPEIVLTELVENAKLQELVKLIYIAGSVLVRSVPKPEGERTHYMANGSHKWISYWWRRKNFPDRTDAEYKNFPVLRDMGYAVVPGAIFFDDFIKTYVALQKQRSSLFRLLPATSGR